MKMKCPVTSSVCQTPPLRSTGWAMNRTCGICPNSALIASLRPGAPRSKRMPATTQFLMSAVAAERTIRYAVPSTLLSLPLAILTKSAKSAGVTSSCPVLALFRSPSRMKSERSGWFDGAGKRMETSLGASGVKACCPYDAAAPKSSDRANAPAAMAIPAPKPDSRRQSCPLRCLNQRFPSSAP